ncbi:MAG: TrkH family potassium uptake protein [bacterium]
MLFKRFRIIKTTRPAPGWLNLFSYLVVGLVFVALALVILFQGYRLKPGPIVPLLMRILVNLAGLGTLTEIILKKIIGPSVSLSRPRQIFDYGIAILLIPTLIFQHLVLPLLIIYQAVNISMRLSRAGLTVVLFGNLRQRPLRMLAFSFLLLICLGTLLLTFPAATADGRGASLITAIFTATSATCVTGLIVQDTPSYFSFFGQLVILCLIQLGGLGIMTFYTSLVVVLGQRLGLTERRTMAELIEESRQVDIARLIRYCILFTLLAEGLGVGILFLRWLFVFRSPIQTLYFAIFHSISAFCNAGFSLFSESFIRFQSDIITNFCIMGLIVIGGLGFPVVNELINRRTLSQSLRTTLRSLTVHARIVLWTTVILIISGTIIFFFVEYDNTLSSLPLVNKLLASLFQSITARTAGFNTVSTAALKPVTLFLWVILMFIGASPGGTGGGIKTSTVAVLFSAVRSRLRGEEEITIANRYILKEIVYRAIAITALGFTIVAIGFAFLLATQDQRFESLLFEAVSAFGTVGLSTGITRNLHLLGKLVIIFLMFIGRIGPLTLTLAMTASHKRSTITYPHARVIVG